MSKPESRVRALCDKTAFTIITLLALLFVTTAVRAIDTPGKIDHYNLSNNSQLLYENSMYYTEKLLPILVMAPANYHIFFRGGPVDLKGSYEGNLAQVHVFGELLCLSQQLPSLIDEHSLTMVSPEFDAMIWSLTGSTAMVLSRGTNDWKINPRAMTQTDTHNFFAWKMFSISVIRWLNKAGKEYLFSEDDPFMAKMKASLLTSGITALPYGLLQLWTIYSGSPPSHHLLVAIPIDHLLSSSVSNNGAFIKMAFHSLLGELDIKQTTSSDEKRPVRREAGYAYIPSMFVHAAIGKSVEWMGFPILGNHYTKGVAYAIADGMDTYLAANGAGDTERNIIMAFTTIYLSYKNFHSFRVIACGFSNRHVKYSYMLLGTLMLTALDYTLRSALLRD